MPAKYLKLALLALPLAAAAPAADPPCACEAPVSPANVETDEGSDRVVGGVNARLGDAPWQVSIAYAGPLAVATTPATEPLVRHACGGALIAPTWVITAAHCLVFDAKAVAYPGSLTVRHGGLRLDRPMAKATIEKIIIHPQWTPSPNQYDIALIKLKSPVKIVPDKVEFVALPGPGQRIPPQVQVTGWGRTQPPRPGVVSPTPAHLQFVVLSIRPDQACIDKGYPWTSADICAGGIDADGKPSIKQACSGDSGGPMVGDGDVRTLFGIVSRGQKCGTAGVPSVYTSVAAFMPWIKATTGLTGSGR